MPNDIRMMLMWEFIPAEDLERFKDCSLERLVEIACDHHKWHHEAEQSKDPDVVRKLCDEASMKERDQVILFLEKDRHSDETGVFSEEAARQIHRGEHWK